MKHFIIFRYILLEKILKILKNSGNDVSAAFKSYLHRSYSIILKSQQILNFLNVESHRNFVQQRIVSKILNITKRKFFNCTYLENLLVF